MLELHLSGRPSTCQTTGEVNSGYERNGYSRLRVTGTDMEAVKRVIVWKLKVKTTVWKGIIICIIKGLNKRHFKNLLSSSIEYILSTPKILGILTQERTVASLKKFIIKFKQGKQTLTMWS